MKKEILETFEKLGFEMEELDDLGYRFMYEGLSYLLIKSDSDEEFLSIAVNVIDEELEENLCYRLMNEINSNLKYIKANMFAERVWLFYERELLGECDLEEVITRMILHLETGVYFVVKTFTEMTDVDDDVDVDDDCEPEE